MLVCFRLGRWFMSPKFFIAVSAYDHFSDAAHVRQFPSFADEHMGALFDVCDVGIGRYPVRPQSRVNPDAQQPTCLTSGGLFFSYK